MAETLLPNKLLWYDFCAALSELKGQNASNNGVQSVFVLGQYNCWEGLPYGNSAIDRRVDIRYFNQRQVRDLVAQYNANGRARLSRGIAQHIYLLTDGHPGLAVGTIEATEKLLGSSPDGSVSLSEFKKFAHFELLEYVTFSPSNLFMHFYAFSLLFSSHVVAHSWTPMDDTTVSHKYLLYNFLSHNKGIQYQDHSSHSTLISSGALALRGDRVKVSCLLIRAAILKSIASALPRIVDFKPVTTKGLLDVPQLIRYIWLVATVNVRSNMHSGTFIVLTLST